jgi:putative redox protein
MSTEDPKAVVLFAGDDLFVAFAPSGHAVTIDTDRARNSAPSPMELLLLALGSCTGVDVVSILRKKRETVTDYRVEVRGRRREDHPRSYERMEVHHIVTAVTFQSGQSRRQLSFRNRNTVASPPH